MGSSVILPSPGQPKEGPDPLFTQPSIPNLVEFRFKKVDPPSALYIQRDDTFTIQVASRIVPETVTVTARILLPFAQAPGQPDAPPASGPAGGPIVGPGYIQTLTKTLALNVANATTFTQFVLTEGYLLSMSVVCSLAAVRGQTFTRVWLQRGIGASTPVNSYEELLADYVTISSPVVWPNSSVKNPSDGLGFLNVYTPVNPAVGTDINVSTVGIGRARLQVFKATLVTSATVINRFPSFQFMDGTSGQAVYQVQETTAVVASTTITYSLAPGGTNVRGGGAPIFETLPVPAPIYFGNNLTVKTVTQGLQAGDQWSAITIDVEEWMEIF